MINGCPYPAFITKHDLNNLPFIQKEVKGEDNDILYTIKIYNTKQSIIFNIYKSNDFSEMIYENEYTLEDFIEIDNFFKSFRLFKKYLQIFLKILKRKK